jgi:hypothetical protein
MATLTSALETDFTPAVGDFIVQVIGGTVDLLRKNSAGAAFANIGAVTGGQIVSNPVTGAVYRFSTAGRAAPQSVQADQ